MNPSPEQITIAVTVYNRRQYVTQAIASALNQTRPVRVMVVEDCGPDSALEAFVKAEFGSRIEYHRNSKRRGLFGNWNYCLELCRTEWISILHDDDFLAPNYVVAMIKLAGLMPGRALYFGVTRVVGEDGALLPKQAPDRISAPWEEKGLKDILFGPFWFPGHLFHVQTAIRVGKFRETSFFCGDWEMWARLMAEGGSAQINDLVAFMRDHGGPEKGTNQVIASGRQYPLIYVQQKRILALLPEGERPKFDRSQFVKFSPLPTRFLLRYGDSLSPRLLEYHVRLLLLCRPPHFGYAVFQRLAKLGGTRLVKLMARIWKLPQRRRFRS